MSSVLTPPRRFRMGPVARAVGQGPIAHYGPSVTRLRQLVLHLTHNLRSARQSWAVRNFAWFSCLVAAAWLWLFGLRIGPVSCSVSFCTIRPGRACGWLPWSPSPVRKGWLSDSVTTTKGGLTFRPVPFR